MDAIFICKVSVTPKWHIPQIIEEFFVRSDCQLVENCPQLTLGRVSSLQVAAHLD
jgi:hypothetical protein